MRLVGLIVYLLGISLVSADPVISEFLASNDQGLEDENGDASDWIEIHNPDATSVNLNGWALTDDISQPGKWTFPSVTLAPGARLVVFASGKNRVVVGSELHTNFSLDAVGEYLALIKPGGVKTSELNPYPPQNTDISYGLEALGVTLVADDAPLKYVLAAPANDAQGDAWTEDDFDDSGWIVSLASNTIFNSTASTPILDLQTVTSNINVSGLLGTIQDVNVTLDITHTWDEDLDVFLRAPDGARIELFTDIGSNGDNFTNTTLDDQAPTVIGSQGAPFTGTYRPENPLDPLSSLNGKDPNGTWQLEVYDDVSSDTGTLNSWSIEITPSISNQTAHGSIGYDTSNEYDIDTQVPTNTTELWVRYPFALATSPSFSSLVLRVRYDDGIEAYLNGTLVHSVNATPPVQAGEAAGEFTNVDISQHASLLKAGQNVLSFRVLNALPTSSDLLLLTELVATSQQASYKFSPEPTPGTANLQQTFTGFVNDTKFLFGRGFYSFAFSETLSCATPGATLVYTTDGSTPTLTNGNQVPAPDASTPPSATISITRTIPIRTAAFHSGFVPTNSDTNTYIFPADVKSQTSAVTQSTYGLPSTWNGVTPEYGMDSRVIGPGDSFGGVYANSIESDLLAVPTLSIVMNQEDLFGTSGIYSHPLESGSNWERATSLELIHPDGSKGFQEDCGLRIQGGAFRRFDITKKKSFRFVFKKQYGRSKLSYDFFGDGAVRKFNSLILRMMSSDSWSLPNDPGEGLFVRDEFGRRVQRALGQESAHGNWMHLYINGVYWGLYHPVERPDSSFAESYYDVPEEEWDGINAGNVINAGDDPDRAARATAAWNTAIALADAVRTASGTSAKHAAYMKLQGLSAGGANDPSYEDYLDVPNYIDYLIVNHYGANIDWPHKNYYCGRHNSPSSTGFKFFMWDYEWTLDYGRDPAIINYTGLQPALVTHNNLNEFAGVAAPYEDLRNSDAFKILFADRIHRALFNDGPLAGTNPATLFTELTDTVRAPLTGESARWGDQHTGTGAPITVNAEWQTYVNSLLANNWLPNRRNNLLAQYRTAGLYPATDAPVFNQHGGSIASGFQLTMTNPNGGGTIYYTTNGVDPLQINSNGSFSLSGSAQNYSSAVPLTVNSTIRARVLSGGVWSALNEADFTLGAAPTASNLVISEFSYQPAESTTGAADGDDFEFIEIMNIGATDLDLGTLEFDLGVTFDFATIPLAQRTLAAGARAVIVEDTASYELRYGTSVISLGQWIGKLSNSGESLRLRIKGGSTVQEFTYDDDLPWPVCADGDGYSLVLVNPQSAPDHTNPANWRCSVQNHGNPGFSDDLPPFTGNANDDGDLDGLPALVEHFLGSTDSDNSSGPDLISHGIVEVTYTLTTRHLTLTFRKKLGQDDLTPQVEVSTNLQSSSWQTGVGHVLLVSQVHNGDGTVTETWRSVANLSSTPTLFIRLKVVQE